MQPGQSLDEIHRGAQLKRDSFFFVIVLLILAALLANLGFFNADRLFAGLSNLGTIGRESIPPDTAVLSTVAEALLETIQTAVAGTLLGFIIALPFGFLGTGNIVAAIGHCAGQDHRGDHPDHSFARLGNSVRPSPSDWDRLRAH